jgi:hypothetical protein
MFYYEASGGQIIAVGDCFCGVGRLVPGAGISTNTLEILESTPGLLVDQDGGIYLSSATPAIIFINGREQKMSSQDIMTILRSLPPGSVQRIEVIRTPSATDIPTHAGLASI